MKALLISLALASTLAGAQVAPDLTGGGQFTGYPDYLSHSCGGVQLTAYATQGNYVGVRAYTNCPTGGRGTKPRRFEACWLVQFAEDGTLIPVIDIYGKAHPGTLLLYATWLQGQPSISCPSLDDI